MFVVACYKPNFLRSFGFVGLFVPALVFAGHLIAVLLTVIGPPDGFTMQGKRRDFATGAARSRDHQRTVGQQKNRPQLPFNQEYFRQAYDGYV